MFVNTKDTLFTLQFSERNYRVLATSDLTLVNQKTPGARLCAICLVVCRGTYLQGLKIGKSNICILDLNFSLSPP